MNSLVLHSIITSTWWPGWLPRGNVFTPFSQYFLTNLPLSQRWRSTPSGMTTKRCGIHKRTHLHLCIGVSAPLLERAWLAFWCLFTYEMEMIFIQFTDNWLVLYVSLFDPLHTGNTNMQANKLRHTFLTEHSCLHMPFITLHLNFDFCQT